MTAFNQGLLGGCCPYPIGYGSGRWDSTEQVPKRLGTAWVHGIGRRRHLTPADQPVSTETGSCTGKRGEADWSKQGRLVGASKVGLEGNTLDRIPRSLRFGDTFQQSGRRRRRRFTVKRASALPPVAGCELFSTGEQQLCKKHRVYSGPK